MGRTRGYWWAPDSAALLVARVDEGPVQRLHIADPSNPGQPATEVRYPAAGTPNAVVSLVLVGLDGRHTPVSWDNAAFPYLVTACWTSPGAALIVVQSRDQREMRLLTVDWQTGATTVLRADSDPHWLDIIPSVHQPGMNDASGSPHRRRAPAYRRVKRPDRRRAVPVPQAAQVGEVLSARRYGPAGASDQIPARSALDMGPMAWPGRGWRRRPRHAHRAAGGRHHGGRAQSDRDSTIHAAWTKARTAAPGPDDIRVQRDLRYSATFRSRVPRLPSRRCCQCPRRHLPGRGLASGRRCCRPASARHGPAARGSTRRPARSR
jgi:hypothetical protein